jgi:F-type H+-transporting ATPase subunit delta
MSAELISSRYARALMMATGRDVRTAQRVARECALVNDHFRRGFGELMANPVFSHAERRSALAKLCDEHKFLDLTRNFLTLLANRARMHLFPDIFRRFRAELDALMGRITVSVISSHPLPTELITEYRRKIEEHYGHSALIRQEVDPELIGGVLIRVGNKLVDGTMNGSIQRFCDRLNLSL